MAQLFNSNFRKKGKTYVIAEIGINHDGNLDKAKQLIQSAARTGADAVKFQTYITEKRVKRNSPIFDILKKCELKFKDFLKLKKFSNKRNIEFFSTPFDDESVEYLNYIGVNIFKIASFDTVNLKLLKKIASLKKTIIMSVGMSNLKEIKKAYSIISKKNKDIALLHCISSYPTNENDANLNCLNVLKRNFDCVIGQSDHTNDIYVPLLAVARGAKVIEKHYKVNSHMKCVDSPVSITEIQMKKMISEIRRIEKIFGDNKLGVRNSEKNTKQFRRFSN